MERGPRAPRMDRERGTDKQNALDEERVARERAEWSKHDKKAVLASVGNVITELAPLFPGYDENPSDVWLDYFDVKERNTGIIDRDPSDDSPRTTELKASVLGGVETSSPDSKKRFPIHSDVGAEKKYSSGHNYERHEIRNALELQTMLVRWTRAAKPGDIFNISSDLLRSGEHGEIQRGEKPEDLTIISGSWKGLRAA